MKLIVGLGNPGNKYENTRHNVGFIVLDALAQELGIRNYELSRKFRSLISFYSQSTSHNPQLVLTKPQTFMNSSGEAVTKIVNYYKIPTKNLYVIHDDLDIKLGEFKVQYGVGPKVHNGINSIEEKLGTKDFWRVRVGVDNRISTDRIPGEDYVLQNFPKLEKEMVDNLVGKIAGELFSQMSK